METLLEEKFYIILVDRWIKEFLNISKMHLPILNLNEMKKPKPDDFFNQVLISVFNEMGQDNALRMVDLLKEKKTFDRPEYYSRVKKRIRELCQHQSLTASSDLMDELTHKVKSIGKHFR